MYGADCHELRNYVQNYAQGKFVTIDDIAEKFAEPVAFELNYEQNAAENNRLACIAKYHIGLFGLAALIGLGTVLKAKNLEEFGIGSAIAMAVIFGTIAHANYVEKKDIIFEDSQII
ncbi:hypothetical protein HY497_01135, partial [Candidatus Woesearchaeota archaeon]|nr:hypothetical protein [Candidatus Woesearchaeota archaeon]